MVKVSSIKIKPVSAYLTVSLLLILSLFCLVFTSTANAASIQVSVDRNPVGLNESFQLVYESQDSPDDDPDFSPLEKYLDILNRSQSSNVSIINGRYTSSKSWKLSVMARQVGDIVLPPIKFGSDLSDSIKISVKPAADNQTAQSAFYSLIRVDKEKVYAQQQIVITQQLFSNKNLAAYGMDELDFNGMDVISQPLGEEKQYKTRIGNTPYLVIERRFAIFPQTVGLLKLSPVMAEARIGAAGNSLFNSFGNSKVVRTRSNSLEISVQAVPDDIHVKPWLPAKSFQLLEQWPKNPAEFVQGEPLTRTLSIKAEGLTAAQLPVLPDISIDGLKQYPDQPLLNDISNDTGITGYRVEKAALIPTRAGEIKLPAIEIPWWNTETQQAEVARVAARTIQVKAAVNTEVTASQAPSPTVANAKPAENQSRQAADIEPPQAVELPASTANQLWFMVAIALAAGWLVTVLAWLNSVSKKKKAVTPVVEEKSSIKQAYKLLQQACNKKDVSACRNQLLLWARSLQTTRDINSLSDLTSICAEPMRQEIAKIDAVLYGNDKQSINFSVILEQAKQMMQQQSSNSSSQQSELLEPLYK